MSRPAVKIVEFAAGSWGVEITEPGKPTRKMALPEATCYADVSKKLDAAGFVGGATE